MRDTNFKNHDHHKLVVIPVALATGLTIGLIVNNNSQSGNNKGLHLGVDTQSVHAQTVSRSGVDSGFQIGSSRVTNIGGYFGAPLFSMHRSPNDGSWVYCMNLGTMDTSNGIAFNRSGIDSSGKIVAGEGINGSTIPRWGGMTVGDLQAAGTLGIAQMAGDKGYMGFAKYQDSIFNGISPNAKFPGLSSPGSFYAMVAQIAIHGSENQKFYSNKQRANMAWNGYTWGGFVNGVQTGSHVQGFSGSYRIYDNGKMRTVTNHELAQMASKLIQAGKRYKMPSLGDYSKESFTMDVQGYKTPYDRTGQHTSTRDDWGSTAHTRSGDDINMKGTTNGLDQNSGQVGTEPIAVTGSNMDGKTVTVSLYGGEDAIKADPQDIIRNGIPVKSHAMKYSDIIGYQISNTPAKTNTTVPSNEDESSISWDGKIYKLGQPVDFNALNGHYIRLVVNGKSDSWNGFNQIHAQIVAAIPSKIGSFPLAVTYNSDYSHQQFASNTAVPINLNAVQMTANLYFHVGQPNTFPPDIPVPPRYKDLRPVSKEESKLFTNLNDKHVNDDGKTNNDEKRTYADGNDNPTLLTNPTQQQASIFQKLLAKDALANNMKLTSGGEYAYTLHIRNRDIQKHGSEILKSLYFDDAQLPKWFVYKSAAVSAGPDVKHQQVSKVLRDNTNIKYYPNANGGGRLTANVTNIDSNKDLQKALESTLTSDHGEVDVTLFGTVDPNVSAQANLVNGFKGKITYKTRVDSGSSSKIQHKPTSKSQDAIKGVISGDVNDFMKQVAQVNPTFGKTAGVTGNSGNSKGYLSLNTDRRDISHIRSLNTNVTADDAGAYGNGTKESIAPSAYSKILPKSLKITSQNQQKNLYYVVIANSGNNYGKDKDGFDRLHFSDYLDPNLKLDLKNRPMMAYDLDEMTTRKAGSGNAVLAPFSTDGSAKGIFNAVKASNTTQSYMSNLIFDTTNQLSAAAAKEYGVTNESNHAMVNGLGAYVNPADMKGWNDGVGKVGNENYTKFYRSTQGHGYKDYNSLGAIEDTDGNYDGGRKLDGAGNEVGWYAFSHGGVENGSTSALRDLDGRQRVSWTVTGSDAKALSSHTVMFLIPVAVKDDAKYVTNNNQTPDIQNDAYFNGSSQKTPTGDMHDGENTDTTNHGNGTGYSNTAYVYPLRKDLSLSKEQNVNDKDGWTKNKKHENFDNDFKFRLNVQMPNWADKNNLEQMHGKDAAFKITDSLEMPYDVKNVTVYDETDNKVLVTNLSQGLRSGQLAYEKNNGWGSSKDNQHPKLVYRPYGNVESNDPKRVFDLANHKLTIQVTVNAPFEQGADNKRLGAKLSNAETDSIYDQYMEKHVNNAEHNYEIPNSFHVSHQSTTGDKNDGPHDSNTVVTTFGSKAELNVDAMRIDTNKLDQGDSFKLLMSTKAPFTTRNEDMTGKVHVKIYADTKDNPHLSKEISLYDQDVDLSKITNIHSVLSFNDNKKKIDGFQQGAQAVGKYTLNGNLNFKGMNTSDKDYYQGKDLRFIANDDGKQVTKNGKKVDTGYLKPDNYDSNGGIKQDTSSQTYGSHRRPLYVRVKVTTNEQDPNRDVSVNGDRSWRGSDGKFVDPFGSGMVGRADIAYRNGIDPRFASISPESSYSYFGQNPDGQTSQLHDSWARAHRGISMIQTVYDATQLHRYNKDGAPTKNQGNVDQTIGAGAGDGMRNDVRMQRFGWGNINSKPSETSANKNVNPADLMDSNKMELIFDKQLQAGSGAKYKNADPSAVKTAKARYYATTGADITSNYGENGSFWNFGNGSMNFDKDAAASSGFKFVNNDDSDQVKDLFKAHTQSESVDKGTGDKRYSQVPRANEHQEVLTQTTSAYGSPVGDKLTNMQTSQYALDGKTGVNNIDWDKDSKGYIADNRAKNIVIDNESGITSIGNAPNSKQASDAGQVYADKKSNKMLATDAGDFFATDVGNNYKNYEFFNRILHRGTGQVRINDDNYKNHLSKDDIDSGQFDSDVASNKWTDSNRRASKQKGSISGSNKFYLPMWFTNNAEHDTFGRGTGEAVINPLAYYSDGDTDRINADYSDVDFTRWLRVFGHRYGFNGSNSSDYDSMLVSGHLGDTNNDSLNSHENAALNNAQNRNRIGTPKGMIEH